MPRFPVLPQRTSAPAAFSNTPRAQAAHFGAGIGRNLAELGSEAVDLGQVVEQRRERQVKQQMSQFDLDLAKQRAQAPPEEASEAKVERYQSIFDTSAEKLLQGYEGQGLQSRLREDIELRREAWSRKLLAGEAQQRLGKSLLDARGLVDHWAGRVAADAAVFNTASQELLGDEASGEVGLLAGLGLRPEALVTWRAHVVDQLLGCDISAEAHRNLDVTLWDPKKREYVTEKLPNSRFYVPSNVVGEPGAKDSGVATADISRPDASPTIIDPARVTPSDQHRPTILPGRPSEPIPMPQLPPSEPGEGRELVPNNTGGNQTDLGPLTELAPGLPAQEQEPQIYVNPDQSDEVRSQTIFLNEEGTPIYDGIPISARFIHKAGKRHEKIDVWYDEKVYPIFDKYVIESVNIELTGSRDRDKRLASKKAVEKGRLSSIPDGYVWHHHQDMRTMQLLPDWVHRMVGHTGGAKNSGKGYR